MKTREQLVHDELEPCPYRAGETARMPLRWQLRPLTGMELDASLNTGDRRIGRMLYRTDCPTCNGCKPIRIPVQDFRFSRSQNRVWRRNSDVDVQIAPATFSQDKLDLYNRHKIERGLARTDQIMSRRGYEGWFLQSCTHTMEFRYTLGDALIGVGIVDVGSRDTSSVYFFFDPDHSHRSLGVFSILVEVSYLQRRNGRYHYLGLFVNDCQRLSYKANYCPHERQIDNEWQRFETPPKAPKGSP